MEQWLINTITTFGLAFAFSGFLIPQILTIAFRKKLFDGHDERKVHKGAVPRLGGIAFVPSVVLSVLFVIGVNLRCQILPIEMELITTLVPLMLQICSLLLLYMVGIADDLIGLRYSNKFVLQVLAAALTLISGIWLGDLEGFIGIHAIPVWLGWPLTIFVIVYIVNALNLIDGIDGLAAGLSTIALITYGIVLYMGGAHIYSMLAWAGVGTLIPFLYFNIFGNTRKGKKIFMGDTGSLTIGMLISFLVLVICDSETLPADEIVCEPLVIALSPIMIPLMDVLRVAFKRIRHKKNPFMPDRSHIHHKLLALGMSSTKALLTILFSAVVFTIFNIGLAKLIGITWTFVTDFVLWTLVNMGLTKLIRRREARLGEQLYE